MPRRRSGFTRRSAPRRQSSSATLNRPQTKPSQQSRTGGLFSGLMGTVFQGMAFGAGSEVAHNVVGGMMGRGQSHAQPQEQSQQQMQQNQQQQGSCQLENSNFIDCLKYNSNQIEFCQSYLDLLKQCEKSN